MRRRNLVFCHPEKTRLLRHFIPFHESDLTDACFKDGLPLTPTPLPKGARGLLSLPRFAGEGRGVVAFGYEGGLRFKTVAVHGQ